MVLKRIKNQKRKMGWTGLDLIDETVGPWKAVFLVLSGPGCSRLILIGLDENRHENQLLWQSCLSEFVPFPTATYSKRGKKAFVFLFLFLKSSRSSHHYRSNRFFSTQLQSSLHTQTQKTRSSPSLCCPLSLWENGRRISVFENQRRRRLLREHRGAEVRGP